MLFENEYGLTEDSYLQRYMGISFISGEHMEIGNGKSYNFDKNEDGWTTTTISLSVFENVDFTDIRAIRFSHNFDYYDGRFDGETEHAIYIDNIVASVTAAKDDDLLSSSSVTGGTNVYGIGHTHGSNQAVVSNSNTVTLSFASKVEFSELLQMDMDVKAVGTGTVTVQAVGTDGTLIGSAVKLSTVDGFWAANKILASDLNIAAGTEISGLVYTISSGTSIYLDNISVSNAMATLQTEADSDILAGTNSISYNKNQWDNYAGVNTGLTCGPDYTVFNGADSIRSWAFKATAEASNSGAVTQLMLSQSYDMTDSYLVFDVRFDSTDATDTLTFNTRLHDSNWADVNSNQGTTVTTDGWQRVTLNPGNTVLSGKDLTDVKFITYTFNFSGSTGAERALYIDNVRVVKIESLDDDWVHMTQDTGSYYCNVTSTVSFDMLKADGSTMSLNVVAPSDAAGKITFSTQADFGENYDMSTGTLAGWFYFGEQTPDASVKLTGNWKGSTTVPFTFTEGGNGWYYGTVDLASFAYSEAGGTSTDVERFTINIPAGYNIYIDGLTRYTTSMEGLTVYYPYNTETYQQDQTVGSRYDALTFVSAKDETESAQMILNTTMDVTSFELTMGGMYSTDGNMIPSSAFEVYVQHYITIDGSKNGENQVTNSSTGETVYDPEAYVDGTNGTFPDALVPMDAKITAGENVFTAGANQGLWINLNVDADYAAGDYSGFATLTINGTSVNIPVSVKIYDVTLPEQVHPKTSFLIWWDQLEAGEGTINGTLATTYYEYLIDKRIMPYNAWQSSDSNWYIDYIAEYLAPSPEISAYSLYYAYDDSTGTRVLNTEHMTTMLTKLIQKNISLANAGSDLDLFEKAYFYFGSICDEPRNDTKYANTQACSDALDAVKAELAPMLDGYPELQESFLNLKHIVTGPDPSDKTWAFIRDSLDYGSTTLTGDDYIYCPQFFWFHTEEERALYADYDEVWWYGCTQPVSPYPTYHLNDDLLSSRVMSWMQYDYDIIGNLYWCVNSWTSKGDALWTGYSTSQPGEGMLLYPGSQYGITGPIGTIRLESVRESNEDYEYLWMFEDMVNQYNEIFGTDYVADDLLQTYLDGLYEGAIPTTDVELFNARRIALLEILEDLSVYLNLDETKEKESDMLADTTGVSYNTAHWSEANGTSAGRDTDNTYGDSSIRSWSFKASASTNMEAVAQLHMGRTFDITGKNLAFDIKYEADTLLQQKFTIRLHNSSWGNLNEVNVSVTVNPGDWRTVVLDFTDVYLDGAALDDLTLISFYFDFASNTGFDRTIYIDNVRLVDDAATAPESPLYAEEVADDWTNMSQDTGSYYCNTEVNEHVYTMYKGEYSIKSLHVKAPADTEGMFTLNTETAFGANFDMSDGILGAWFYFGDQTPSANLVLTGNWKGSVPAAFTFGEGENGWYYGAVDISAVTYYETAGTSADVERLTIKFPAGYEIYVDSMTCDPDGYMPEATEPETTEPEITEPETTVDPEVESDILANATLEWNPASWGGDPASYDSNSTEVNGENSTKSWKFYTTSDSVSLGAQLKLNATFDLTGKDLVFDVKFVNATQSITIELWNNWTTLVTTPIGTTIYGADGWQTIVVPAADIAAAVGDAAMNEIYLIRFNFNFASDTSGEHAVYIDNVRFVEPGTVEPDPAEPTEPETTVPETEPETTVDPDAASDMLAGAVLQYNKSHWDNYEGSGNGQTLGVETENVYGSESTKSWYFKADASATGSSATAQFMLTETYDMTDCLLVFDAKYVTESTVEQSLSIRLHKSNWGGDLNTTNAAVSLVSGDWRTYMVDFSSVLLDGADTTDLGMISFYFDFSANTGFDREIYIDNVRLVKKETVSQDWINMYIDSGDSTAT